MGPAAAEVREPDAGPVEEPVPDEVDSDGPAAAEVREPNEEGGVGSEASEVREPVSEDGVGSDPAELRDPMSEDGVDVAGEDRGVVDGEDRASPVPTIWMLDHTSRFSKKSEASTGMAAFEVNFTP